MLYQYFGNFSVAVSNGTVQWHLLEDLSQKMPRSNNQTRKIESNEHTKPLLVQPQARNNKKLN